MSKSVVSEKLDDALQVGRKDSHWKTRLIYIQTSSFPMRWKRINEATDKRSFLLHKLLLPLPLPLLCNYEPVASQRLIVVVR